MSHAKVWLAAQVLCGAELVSALMLPGAYLFPFVWGFRSKDWADPANLFGFTVQIAFVVVPAVSLIALVRQRFVGFWGLYVSPILSFLLGVGSLPFVSYAVPIDGYGRTVFIGVLNLMAIAVALMLRRTLARITDATALQ